MNRACPIWRNREPRSRPVTRHLPKDDAAIIRLAVALLLEQNDEWTLQRRYVQLEWLQTVSDNGMYRISALVTSEVFALYHIRRETSDFS